MNKSMDRCPEVTLIVSQPEMLFQTPYCEFSAEASAVDFDNLRGGQREISGQQDNGILDSFHYDHFDLALEFA